MNINLNNVNISLAEFQRMSKGDYNAGEVRLAGENKLEKVNNHVRLRFLNNKTIDHAEVIAIKNAFVNALKTKYPQSGLSDNEIQGLAASLFATGLVTDENVNTIVDAQADAVKKMQSLFDSRFATQKNALTQSLTDSLKESLKGDFEKTFKEKYHNL